MLNPPRSALIYFDASGPGHIGAVTFFDDCAKMEHAHAHLPGWLLELGGIYEFGITGAIFGLLLASVFTPGRPIVICIDNTSASSGLVRGNCNAALCRDPTSIFWMVAAHFLAPYGSNKFGQN